MKKLSLILTTAILATSSVALADHPSAPVTAPAPIVRDHRFDNDRFDNDRFDNDRFDDDDDFDGRYTDRHDRRFDDNDAYEYRDGRWSRRPALVWENLGTVGAGKAVLDLSGHRGRYKSIRLDVRGRMQIRRVVILFADGTRQVMAMRSMVHGRMASPVIDLGGPRRIEALAIYSSPWSRGSVTVTGLKMQRFARRF